MRLERYVGDTRALAGGEGIRPTLAGYELLADDDSDEAILEDLDEEVTTIVGGYILTLKLLINVVPEAAIRILDFPDMLLSTLWFTKGDLEIICPFNTASAEVTVGQQYSRADFEMLSRNIAIETIERGRLEQAMYFKPPSLGL